MELSKEFEQKFRSAKSVCVLTGAGVSAESGVPTFRGGGDTTAVWKGMPFDQISSARMVSENLAEVWEWFDYRRGVLSKCTPNPAHETLAKWEQDFSEFTLVTQNVDGLHARAGSKNVIEVHGNINRSRCLGCGVRFDMDVGSVPHTPVKCNECSGNLRPDVVLFGEMLPAGVFEEAVEKAAVCELFFVIGTSALVYPAASLPEIAKRNGAYVVEVNPEKTPLSELCDESFRGRAGEILQEINRVF